MHDRRFSLVPSQSQLSLGRRETRVLSRRRRIPGCQRRSRRSGDLRSGHYAWLQMVGRGEGLRDQEELDERRYYLPSWGGPTTPLYFALLFRRLSARRRRGGGERFKATLRIETVTPPGSAFASLKLRRPPLKGRDSLGFWHLRAHKRTARRSRHERDRCSITARRRGQQQSIG